ncbi:MAG: hypothetical protein ACOXZS_05210 [Bacilli bacterium]
MLNKPQYLWQYISILSFLIVILSFGLYKYTYDLYYRTNGIVVINDHNYYLKLYVDVDDLNKVVNSRKILIDHKEYNYQIKEISSEMLVDNNFTNYKEVWLECQLDKKYLNNNNVITLSIRYKTEALIKLIYKFIIGKEN